MATYWSFAFGTAILVSARWYMRHRPAPQVAPRAVRAYNDDIEWL